MNHSFGSHSPMSSLDCRRLLDTVMTLAGRLWCASFEVPTGRLARRKKPPNYRSVAEQELFKDLAFPTGYGPQSIVATMESKGLVKREESEIFFSFRVVNFFLLARAIIHSECTDADIRYFIRRNIRNKYRCLLTPDTVRQFNLLANAVNHLATHFVPGREPHRVAISPHWDYKNEFLPALHSELRQGAQLRGLIEPELIISAFIDCCRLVGYLAPSRMYGHIVLRAASVDGEYLLSRLFGLPTDIRGFDELFGGGGVVLAESLPTDNENLPYGRSIVLEGRYGTGKSILCLQFCWEVARKGGIAWLMAMEQTPEKCIHLLHAIGSDTLACDVEIVTDPAQVGAVLSGSSEPKGALIILATIKDSFEDFLSIVLRHSKQLKRYPLRLICIDPINSVYQDHQTPYAERRNQTLIALEEIKRDGTNLLMISEEEDVGSSNSECFLFGKYISDTVIRLSVQRLHGYSQRYCEVTKSRFQREQRGAHPFSIQPGAGVRILTSSAAVAARVARRAVRGSPHPITFSASLEREFPELGIMSGDLIFLMGDVGTHKTELCAHFALGTDNVWPNRTKTKEPYLSRKYQSVIVTTREEQPKVLKLVHECYNFSKVSSKVKNPDSIRFCILPSGYIQPGSVLQSIQDQFAEADAENAWIDRVAIHKTSAWEAYPFIRSDPTFTDALIALLRSYLVTNLVTYTDQAPNLEASLKYTFRSNADCVIVLESIELSGSRRVLFQAIKARQMPKDANLFELSKNRDKITIRASSPLMRRQRGGVIKTTPIRFFLTSRSVRQQEYNQDIATYCRATLSADTVVVDERLAEPMITGELGITSGVDELQVVQIEHAWLPTGLGSRSEEPSLVELSSSVIRSMELNEFDSPLLKYCKFSSNSSVITLSPHHRAKPS
jgi:KaiC/GvpD/RAD55 family RecA-like ATPase